MTARAARIHMLRKHGVFLAVAAENRPVRVDLADLAPVDVEQHPDAAAGLGRRRQHLRLEEVDRRLPMLDHHIGEPQHRGGGEQANHVVDQAADDHEGPERQFRVEAHRLGIEGHVAVDRPTIVAALHGFLARSEGSGTMALARSRRS